MSRMTPEELAEAFHESYERHAPEYGYETRRASAVPWESVPAQNKLLMMRVACEMWWRMRWHVHHWELVARVSPPMWDRHAEGKLWRCSRCGKMRAR